ncbi:replication-relaxation family protein [Streptomyces acidiscabies]|uniref:Replication-relaxation family protein n=1 Tax=Streptomyces acidiscabies TaxID=42234 RepID=A0AAP6ELA4_9ACTN|nr:replication-relaxation family protein [Streptomyces acidiscabies]MBZ3918147.1 replication-relaxation family protein [Streptomyces acidiscabies]MDX2966455.1 replication-relaxation family protein [Streptomyces acidiscabies]MDX3796401.1 replication-relaxation family protein [Streptomyces acidiscabies]
MYDNTDDDREDTAREGACQPHAGGAASGAGTGPAPVSGDADETAGQEPVKGAVPEQDTSIPALVETPAAPRKLTSTAQTRGLLMLMLSRVRIATAAQLATVLTREGTGVGYMRRGLRDLRALGFVDYGRHGREMVWHLTTLGQRAVAEGGDVVMRPHAATGERAIAAGLAPHGLAVTDVISLWGGPILDWEVEVDHTIDKVRRVVSDAVLYRPSRGAEVEFLEMDRFTMSISRLALKLRAYEAYSRATYFEGERGTIGSTKRLWRQRYPDSRVFPVVRLVLAGTEDVEALDRRATALERRIRGIGLRVDVAALPRLLQTPSPEWTWRPIGLSDEQARNVA